MKKNLLMGMVGLGAMALCITGVKAETLDLTNVSETGQNVTVGEVDVPVYSVDITWGDMTFDYKYNEVTRKYGWREQITCEKLEGGNSSHFYNSELKLYSDNACEKELDYNNMSYEDVVNSGAYYSVEKDYSAGTIEIIDNSVNGKVQPSISWSSEQNYDFVDANFYYEGTVTRCALLNNLNLFNYLVDNNIPFYTDVKCTLEGNAVLGTFDPDNDKYYYKENGGGWVKLEGNVLTENTAMSSIGENNLNYRLKLELVNNSSKLLTTPTKGDRIGTVTITINAK